MNKLLIGICLVLFPCLNVKAQWIDNFSDGDFTSNPKWNGDTSDFKIDQGMLRLTALKKTDTSILSAKSNIGLNAVWKGSVKYSFNPSSSNYSKIYLMADNSNLSQSNKAYYIKIGGSDDDISLYVKDGKSELKLIDGRNQLLNSTNVNVSFKITRNSAFEWELFSDSNNSGIFISEGGVSTDSTFLVSSYFGVLCRYTSTRSDKFYFDDFSVSGEVFADTIGPFVAQHEISGAQTWNIFFSEPIDTTSISANNIRLSQSNNLLKKFTYSVGDRKLALQFDNLFTHGVPLLLNLELIKDTSNNIMKSQQLQGVFTNNDSLLFKDIIFNELMIDPSPPIKLPEIEYIELLNRSKYQLNLQSWSLTDTKDTCILPMYIIKPNELLCLVDEKDRDQWSKSNTIFVENLPGLNNDGDCLQLYAQSLKTIDALCYTKQWYGSSTKEEGGWSLELVNPNYYCSDSSNWKASDSDLGGSPGITNSVFSASVDSQLPIDLKFLTLNNQQIELKLNQSILHILSSKQVQFSPDISIKSIEHSYLNINIEFEDSNHSTTAYYLMISGWIDCFNHALPDLKLEFSFPEDALTNDIVINELLFNPYSGGSDFVEIYNRSDKIIDLQHWNWANLEDGQIGNLRLASDVYLPILPQHYMVFTKDPDDICFHYFPCKDSKIFSAQLPSYNDDQGSVVLLNSKQQVIDRFDYSDDLHFPLIQNTEGVSLERISPSRPSRQLSNWHSASSTIGFASPGYKNSQSTIEGDPSEVFYLHPSIFSPDNDSYNDVVSINYIFDKPGYVGSIKIFNEYGILVRDLVSNQLLSISGSFSWDGIDNNHNKSPIGYYIVLMEIFNVDGRVDRYRSTVVLAHQLQ